MYSESGKTFNEMTLNELVKLTTLWTTGAWNFQFEIHKYEATKAEIQRIQATKISKAWSDIIPFVCEIRILRNPTNRCSSHVKNFHGTRIQPLKKLGNLVNVCQKCVRKTYENHAVIFIYPVSILRKSISGRHRPVKVADGPMTTRCSFT